MSTASERPAVPITALTEESLLSSVDPPSEISESTPLPNESLVPTFPSTYDPEWALKDPQFNKAPPRYKKKRTHKAPKDSKIYKAVTAIIAMKAQGFKSVDIAEQLGLTANTLRQYVYTAHKRGWVNVNTFHDPEDKLELVLKSKAITNLNTLMDEKETVVIDKETGETADTDRLSDRAGRISLEIAKGTGMLKTHTVEKGTQAPPIAMALRVQVEIPQLPGNTGEMKSLPTVRAGSSGGVPAFDAEIIGE